jgi:hypothetical protein
LRGKQENFFEGNRNNLDGQRFNVHSATTLHHRDVNAMVQSRWCGAERHLMRALIARLFILHTIIKCDQFIFLMLDRDIVF